MGIRKKTKLEGREKKPIGVIQLLCRHCSSFKNISVITTFPAQNCLLWAVTHYMVFLQHGQSNIAAKEHGKDNATDVIPKILLGHIVLLRDLLLPETLQVML